MREDGPMAHRIRDAIHPFFDRPLTVLHETFMQRGPRVHASPLSSPRRSE